MPGFLGIVGMALRAFGVGFAIYMLRRMAA